MEFDLKESNMRRSLRPDEALVYSKFKEMKDLLISGKLTVNDKFVCDEVDYYSQIKEKVWRGSSHIIYFNNKTFRNEGLLIETYINFSKGWLSVQAEASANGKSKDIDFQGYLNNLSERFIMLSKEFKGMGNGSYYVYDTVTDKVVYREDD